MEKIVECVPNFSEGRNMETIGSIVRAIEGEGDGSVRVLDVDSGEGVNRTVITFAGSPEAVEEAAFRAARTACRLIDMRHHKGTHPRSGAVDVLPFVPVRGVGMEECVQMARRTAERMYRELGVPCYCYEAAAFRPERRNLAVCRSGEYEGLPAKLADPDRRPDFGPESMTEEASRSGASNVGARKYLIAVNFNLDTDSVEVADDIACAVREKGRALVEDGKVLRDSQGKVRMIPGRLKGCKAIGWHIREYGFAQVSMNITDIEATPLHKAFEAVKEEAQRRGRKVTGTELVGMVPLRVLTEAGAYFSEKEGRSADGGKMALAGRAAAALGLDWNGHFTLENKIIEMRLGIDVDR
ncbi:MAG: glutamate formimidoyltransferase [Candidatus Cryptobacteroides sp.]